MFEKSHGLGVLKPIHLESLTGKKAIFSHRESTKNSQRGINHKHQTSVDSSIEYQTPRDIPSTAIDTNRSNSVRPQ